MRGVSGSAPFFPLRQRVTETIALKSADTLAHVTSVDVVVVSYNSRDTLRSCVAPLAGTGVAHVVVVDNASSDRCLETVADLPVLTLPQPDNRGFAHGCNIGLQAGHARFVLLLNPDAVLEPDSLGRLVAILEADERAGAVAPQIRESDGSLAYSLRRFPRARSSFARALFLHRLFPRASWSDELIRDERAYDDAWSPPWVSGACVLLRRRLLEELGGLDEGFFLYSEDNDLCRRVRDAGFDVRYEPGAVATHAGGASAPRTELLPVLAASRIRYARKHGGVLAALLERTALTIESALRSAVSPGRAGARSGHWRTLGVTLGVSRPAR
jgi:N-acetylglucosaminyl-diphospho-decaprenol L-rhamnosyltransferase